MLPFNKRNARTDDLEDLKTGDILEAVRSTRRGAPRSARPQVFERLQHPEQEEVTVMMPSKRTLPPPPAMGAAGRPNLVVPSPLPYNHVVVDPSSASGGYPASDEPAFEADEAPLPVHNGGRTHVLSPSPLAMPVARSYVEPVQPAYAFPFNGHAQPAPASIAPVAMSVAPNAEPSDPRFEVPATVITTRTKVLTGRPTVSWAAALVAMGVFAGLVTAVIARGDGDSMFDATVAFADSHGVRAPGARPVVQSMPAAKPATPAAQPVAAAAKPVPPPVVIPAAQAATPMLQVGPVLGDMARATSAINDAAAKKAPTTMAYAKPQEPKAAEPKVEAKVETKDEAAPKKAPAPKVAMTRPAAPPAAKAKKASSGGTELANAEEAKKLADAQLEAALR